MAGPHKSSGYTIAEVQAIRNGFALLKIEIDPDEIMKSIAGFLGEHNMAALVIYELRNS
jgi:hypothetical protein